MGDRRPAPGGDPLGQGASRSAIREALLPEDRAGFDAAYAGSLVAARDTLDLTELVWCLEHW
ncbi:MAG: DUF6247 family protein [Geodermatophilaceae bacterium]